MLNVKTKVELKLNSYHKNKLQLLSEIKTFFPLDTTDTLYQFKHFFPVTLRKIEVINKTKRKSGEKL